MRKYELHKAFPFQYLFILIASYYVRSTHNLVLSPEIYHPAFIFVFFWSGLAVISATEIYYDYLKAYKRNDYWWIVSIGVVIGQISNLTFLGMPQCLIAFVIFFSGGVGLLFLTLPGLFIGKKIIGSTRTRAMSLPALLAVVPIPAVFLYFLIK